MIKLLTNKEHSVRQALTDGLSWCNEFRVATAFLTENGFHMLSDDILRLIGRGGTIRIIIGLDNAFSDYNAILEFATLVGDCKCKLFKSELENQETTFHPKIYIFSRENEERAILGSSNLTGGGILTNIEANVHFDESRFNREIVRQINNYFNWLWEHPNALPVEENDAYLEEYRKLSQRKKQKAKQIVKRERDYSETIEKVSSLDESIELDSSAFISDIRFSYFLGSPLFCMGN